jgi:hypothetical protein
MVADLVVESKETLPGVFDMKIRATGLSFLTVSSLAVFLVSCGSNQQESPGAELLTLQNSSELLSLQDSAGSNSKLDKKVIENYGRPTIAADTIYVGYNVLCQDGLKSSSSKKGTAKQLFLVAEATCKGRAGKLGKVGIAAFEVLQSSIGGDVQPVEAYGFGYTVVCQDGTKKTVVRNDLLSSLYADAESTCKNSVSISGKKGINSYSALLTAPKPQPTQVVVGVFGDCQDGSVFKIAIAPEANPLSIAEGACKGRKNQKTGKIGLNSFSVILN